MKFGSDGLRGVKLIVVCGGRCDGGYSAARSEWPMTASLSHAADDIWHGRLCPHKTDSCWCYTCTAWWVSKLVLSTVIHVILVRVTSLATGYISWWHCAVVCSTLCHVYQCPHAYGTEGCFCIQCVTCFCWVASGSVDVTVKLSRVRLTLKQKLYHDYCTEWAKSFHPVHGMYVSLVQF